RRAVVVPHRLLRPSRPPHRPGRERRRRRGRRLGERSPRREQGHGAGRLRQRAMIAMALLFTPQLVMMDEPTSALDVVAQRSLMSQIKDLQRSLGFAVIFVTHDMSVVSRYSDRVMVMYAGQIAEAARTEAIFARPLHPYTRGLMSAFPSVAGPRRELIGIPGAPPDPARPPSGCRF